MGGNGLAVVRIDSLEAARHLAVSVLDEERANPVICVTTRHRESEPLVDAAALATAVDPLTVYVLPTGELTWELTAVLPDHFEVFGGAARIWWPGLRDTDDPHGHPLIFCWSADEAGAALQRMIRELRRGVTARSGSVSDPQPQRPIQVPKLRPPERPPWVSADPFDALVTGGIVDGKVVEAQPGGAEVQVVPGVNGWLVRRRRDGPLRLGETVAIRITAIDRVDRRVEISAAPRKPSPAPAPAAVRAPDAPRVQIDSSFVDQGPDSANYEEAMSFARVAVSELRAEADDIRRELAGEIAAARARVLAFVDTELKDLVGALERDLGEAQASASSLRHQLSEAERDKRAAILEMRRQRDRATDAVKDVRGERDRRSELESQLHGYGHSDDPEQQFRHEVSVLIRRTVPTSDDAARRVADYAIGPYFLASLEMVEGVGRTRVVSSVASLLTGRAPQSGSAGVHAFRTSTAGTAPQRIRGDGARAFRLSLQHNTPAARRLLYWQLKDGSIELANIAYHDNYEIS